MSLPSAEGICNYMHISGNQHELLG